MYTIEKHLEDLSHTDENCKTIYSIWNLNKKNLKRALSTIQITFPHYSIHDYSHADTIIQNIELFLGENRIKTLSVTDAWLILMSAYTHDIGMIVFMKDLEEKFDDADFLKDLEGKANNKFDHDLAEAAHLILRLLPSTSNRESLILVNDFTMSYALRIKKAITILSADLFRKIHHEQSKLILQGMDESFANEFNKFYSSDIPVRFLQVLGDIAYSHGIDFYETMELLPQKSNGYASDYMHPRFIAFMLRLGDLLDVDDKRFNQFTTKVFEKQKVKLSAQHEQKHASVKHLLVTHESIEVIVDCKEDEGVYRIANQWFDYLKGEIENQSREWSKIRPEYLQGLAPSFSRNKIQVLFNGKMADTDLMNLQFNISKEKTFEIFEGSALYDDPSFVFLREITQNAVDATKIQLWKDIEKGVYDILFKQNFEEKYGIETSTWTHDEIMQNIIFPSDIPNSIYSNYEVVLSIDWESINGEKCLVIEITDKGCGISKISLIRMCQRVGDSRSKDKQFQDLKERMPFFLKPTGAFGLGLQSIFLVAEEFEVLTKNEDDKGWDVIFRSAKDGQYISAIQATEKRNTGTSLRIRIPEKKLENLFVTTTDFVGNEYYDEFTDVHGNPIIWQMISFSKAHLLQQKFLNVYVLGNLLRASDIEMVELSNRYDYQIISYEEFDNERIPEKKMLISLGFFMINTARFRDNDYKHLGFKVFEELNPKSGTEISMQFLDSFEDLKYGFQHFSHPHFRTLYSVRDIDIRDDSNNFFYTIYSRLNINFLNPQSDKILNIARNKLIKKSEHSFSELFQTDILKRILPEIKLLFEKKFEDLCRSTDGIEAQLAVIYFHIQLTFQINKMSEKYVFFDKFYQGLYLPEYLLAIYDGNLQNEKTILAIDFFKTKKVFVNQLDGPNIKKIIAESKINEFDSVTYESVLKTKEAYGKILSTERGAKIEGIPIVWASRFFYYYLTEFFSVKALFISESYSINYGLELEFIDQNSFPTIELDEIEMRIYFTEVMNMQGSYWKKRRSSFYAISPYASKIAVKASDSFSVNLPSYANHGIISPFVGFNQFFKIKHELREIILSNDSDAVKDIVNKRYLEILISEKMIDFIVENASINQNPSRKEIKNTYLEFIVYLLLLF